MVIPFVPGNALATSGDQMSAVQVYGGVPPAAASVNEYAEPAVALGKLALVIVSVRAVTAMPVPVSITICGEPVALSVMVKDAEAAPVTCG